MDYNNDISDIRLDALGWERSDPTRVLKTFPRDYYRFHFITSGYGYCRTADEYVLLAPGEGFFIFPGGTPNYYPQVSDPWEYFWVAMHGKSVETMIAQNGFSRSSTTYKSLTDMDSMRQILADMCATSISPSSADQLFSRYLCDFLSNITPLESRKRKGSLFFEQCLAFVIDNYATHLTMQDITNHFNIDRTYLYKMFKKNLGVSPQAYLLNYRISKACDLLQSTQDSITNIAYTVGFRDYSDFSRQFKSIKHITPTAYRKAHGRENTWNL